MEAYITFWLSGSLCFWFDRFLNFFLMSLHSLSNHLSLLKLWLPGQYFFTLNSFDRPNVISLAKHKHTSVKTTITVQHVDHLRTSFQFQLETPDLDVVVDPVMFMLRF